MCIWWCMCMWWWFLYKWELTVGRYVWYKFIVPKMDLKFSWVKQIGKLQHCTSPEGMVLNISSMCSKQTRKTSVRPHINSPLLTFDMYLTWTEKSCSRLIIVFLYFQQWTYSTQLSCYLLSFFRHIRFESYANLFLFLLSFHGKIFDLVLGNCSNAASVMTNMANLEDNSLKLCAES